jgi:hypothetical protein
MGRPNTSLSRFIRRVYWRLVLVRLVEWAGIGFAIACGLALPLIPLLRNRSDSPLMLAAIMMAIGAVIGLIAAALRGPRIIDAAVEADRQLDLADLLATAWHLEQRASSDEFEQTVLLLAEQQASALRPASVILNRLGMRAWGGIGLAGALVLTVAILSANPLDTQAAFSPLPQASANKNKPDQRQSSKTSQNASTPRPTAIGPDHPRGQDDPLPSAGKTTEIANKTPAGQNSGSQMSNPNGTGTGAGQSQTSSNNKTPDPTGTNASRTNNTGPAASGVGASTKTANTTSGNNTSTAAGASDKSSPIPAWQSDSWPQSRDAANAAITNGQIPAAYHDLVREYFKR